MTDAARPRSWSLRARTLLVLGLSTSVLVALSLLALDRVVLGSFDELERQAVERDLQRAQALLDAKVQTLVAMAEDNAAWDDAFEYLARPTPAFEKNFELNAFVRQDVDVVAYSRADGPVVFSAAVDRLETRATPFPEALRLAMTSRPPLRREGLWLVRTAPSSKEEEGPRIALLLFAQRPVVPSAEDLPPRGTFLVGRYLTPEEVRSMGEAARLQLALSLDPDAPGDAAPAVEGDAEVLRAAKPLLDADGRTVGRLTLAFPRDIHARGRQALLSMAASVLAIGALICVLVYALLEALVLRRLRRLAAGVEQVRARGDAKARLSFEGPAGDEVARLGGAIDGMLEALEQAELQRREHVRLRDREEQYRALVESSPDAMLILEGFRVVFANRAAAQLLCVEDPADLIFGTLTDKVVRDDAAALQAHLHAAEEGRPAPPITLRVPHGEGAADVEFAVARCSYKDEDALLVAARDVTRATAVEQALRQSQKMEAIGRLAGGVAHDFNNLLTVILGGLSDGLLDLPEQHAAREGLLDAHRSARRAAELTRQLLAFSRKSPMVLRPVDVGEVAEGMRKMLRRLIGEDVQLSLLRPEGVWAARTDPGQLEQVLLNLGVNARDAMPWGGRLEIAVGNRLVGEGAGIPPGEYVALSVRDTGVGMSEEVRAHLFEPFFTTKERGKGTGLGLATVYGIVQQCGGLIRVESAPGKGSVFEVLLPRAAQVEEAASAERQDRVLQGRETVLVVEDEELVRRAVHRALDRLGYHVLEASSAEQALDLCRAQAFDVLLTDMVMPGMNGCQLAERTLADRRARRVLFMSGYTDDAVLQRAVVELGAGFIAKPFSPEVLAQKVREVLDTPRA